ncbi:MAG TPA: sigma-70 family RNA polymerase sigma factor [Blastocatellia bacterium]
MEKHHRESYGWALMCCARNSTDAENVLQTVYLKVLEGKARFDGRAAFKTWLFSVIRRTASDHRRREMIRRLRLIGREEEANERVSFDEAIYRSEIQSLFRQSLASLPRRQQEVLQLVFYHDLSLSEAARVMGVSVGSARTHYERGKKHLRHLIEESGVFDESPVGRRKNPSTLP